MKCLLRIYLWSKFLSSKIRFSQFDEILFEISFIPNVTNKDICMLHVYKNYGHFAWISFRRCHLSKCFKNFVEELVKFFFLSFFEQTVKEVLHHAKAYEVKRCVNFLFQSETKTFLIQKKRFFDLHGMETFFPFGKLSS